MNKQSCVVVRKKQIADTLKQESSAGKRLLEPLKSFAAGNELPMNILEDKEISNDAEVHMHEADLWHCLEGGVKFVYGGEMVDPWFGKNPDGSENRDEIKAKEIKGGDTVVLCPGDWFFIPAGQPHSHSCKGTARLVIIKIPQK